MKEYEVFYQKMSGNWVTTIIEAENKKEAEKQVNFFAWQVFSVEEI